VSDSAIRLDGLTKYYGKRLGVADLSFEVAPGEVFGFLGPNGAGKTTAIRMLAGLLAPSAGSATVLGGSPQDPATRARIGYLPGSLALYKHLTVRSFLHFVARMRQVDCDAEITRLCALLGLETDRRIGDLSKGNRQKVGVVQAFMHRPDVLILDEPTSGLDPLVQRAFESLLAEVRDRGAAVLLSSHVLSEVEHLAQRVAIIDRGHLLMIEQIEALKGRAVRRLDLYFDAPVDASRFASLPEVNEATASGNELTCTMSGRETEVLRLAVELGVRTVHTHEPTLDEIFLGIVDEREAGEGHGRRATA